MSASRFSIRHQLLLLGALATASIWTGALLQYLELRERSNELAVVRHDLASADRYAAAARLVAQERGLGNGWLAQTKRSDPAELTPIRQEVDMRLAGLSANGEALVPAIAVRRDDLARVRGRIDRREIVPTEAFGFYSAFVSATQDVAAHRLARSMLDVGLPYEHVSHLQGIVEHLAQIRGLTNGALQAGVLAPPTEAALARQLVLLEEGLRLYQRAVPNEAERRITPALDAAPVRTTLGHVRTMLALHRLDVVPLDPTSWWSLATEAVDTLDRAAAAESVAIGVQAGNLIDSLERTMRWTVAALVVLGTLTLVMVFSTVGRIVVGLDRLLEGLDAVGTHRDFDARIESATHDEFGRISGSINKLIAIAGSVVEEQEALSQTDALTGAVNRRGFDRQLEARTTAARVGAPSLALVMIDVDHFKSVNDEFGHPQGDLVLKGLAQVLHAGLRPDDVLARFGGEEFVALLPGCQLDDAIRVAEKLRLAVEAHDFGIGRQVTASFGVSGWRRGQAAATLVADADSRLYAAKAAGRNRVMPLPMIALVA